MKSGPTLKGCTTRPRRRKTSSNPSVIVVFPTPLAAPATTSAGITGMPLDERGHRGSAGRIETPGRLQDSVPRSL